MTPANAPLPGILAEVSEVAGRDAAIALAISLGGREIYIPPPEWIIEASDHPLIAATGPQAAARIAGRLSPDRVYVPRARQAAAVWLAGQGLTTAEIAVRLGISRRTARRYRRAVLF